MTAWGVARGLGIALLAVSGAQSCKSPAETFECASDSECDLPQGGGQCRNGRCHYDSQGSGGEGGGGSGGTGDGGGSGGGSAGGDASGGRGAGGGSGSSGTGSAPTMDPDGGEGVEELTVVAGAIGGKGSIDGLGALARFMSPACIAFDGDHSIYVGDTDAGTIRRFDTNTGAVITVAGRTFGTGYVNGNGGDARFTEPECVYYDGTDPQRPALYVAEWGGNRIRKVDINDGFTVSHLAGSTDAYGGYIDAVGEAAQLNAPVAMVRRGNFLYVADTHNNALRSINLTTRAVATVIGVPGQADKGDTDGAIAVARLDTPHALALHPNGNTLYIGEHDGKRIRVLDFATSTVSKLVATDGSVTSLAYLPGSAPRLVATLYPQKRILDVNIGAKTVTNLAGSGAFEEVDGPPTVASFRGPHGVVVMPDGSLFVADTEGPTIRRLVPAANGAYQTTTFAGARAQRSLNDGPGKDARFDAPGDMVLAPDGNTIYVLDGTEANCAIRTFQIDTREVGTFAGGSDCAFADGSGVGARFDWPSAMTQGVAAGSAPPPLFVAEQKGVVRRVDTATKGVTHLNDPVEDGLLWRGIAATDTTIYLAGAARRRIYALSVTGGVPAVYAGSGEEGCADAAAASSTFKSPAGLLWDGESKLYVADQDCGSIRRIDLDSNVVTTVAGGNLDQDDDPDGIGRGARFGYPAALTWDSAKKGFYVQDIHAIRWVNAETFEVKTVLGVPDVEGGVWLPPAPPRLNFPGGFIEGPNQELYITSESAILRWGKGS